MHVRMEYFLTSGRTTDDVVSKTNMRRGMANGTIRTIRVRHSYESLTRPY